MNNEVNPSETRRQARLDRLTMQLNRRRLLALAAGGSLAAGTQLLACSNRSNGQPSSTAGGAGSKSAAGTPQRGGTLQAYFATNFPLDPQKGSVGAQRVVSGVMSRVFRFKTGTDPATWSNHDLENDLGLSAESPDAVTWTIKLRPGAKFHNVAPVNGRAVEAEDIKATFVRAVDPATGNPNRGSLSMIDPSQIQTPAKDTVTFKLSYPYGPFKKTLGSAAYSLIFPREVLTGGYDPTKVVIGSGPFILDSFTPDVALVYKRNPDWVEPGEPYVDGMRLAIIPSAAQQLAQFTAGHLDEIFPDVQSLDTARQQNPRATVLSVPSGSPSCIFFQLGDSSSAFRDIRLRQAFSMAIDRSAISRAIYAGQGKDTLFVPGFMGNWALRISELPPNIAKYYSYNPSEAKQLLQAAGATDLQLRFAYIATGPFSTPQFIKQAQTVNSMLNAIGIKTEIVTQDYNIDFIAGGKGSRQGYFPKDMTIYAGVTQSTDADEWLFSYFHSSSTSNGEQLKDPKLDALITKERSLTNEDGRRKAARDAEQYIAEQVYVVPTGGGPTYTMLQPWVQNYDYSDTIGREEETYAKLWLKQ